MTILGLGIMTPNSVRIWLELQKPEPNRALITGLKIATTSFKRSGSAGCDAGGHRYRDGAVDVSARPLVFPQEPAEAQPTASPIPASRSTRQAAT